MFKLSCYQFFDITSPLLEFIILTTKCLQGDFGTFIDECVRLQSVLYVLWQVEKDNKEELMFQSDSEDDSCDDENASGTSDSKPTAPEESNMSR